MTMSQPLPPEAEQFLRRLRSGLAALPPDEREEIVREVRSHLAERQSQGKGSLLEEFGEPEAYAARFLAEHALTGALASGTSVALGRALLVGLRDGFVGLFVLVPLLCVQIVAGALVLAGALKPVFPTRVGLFLDSAGRLVSLGLWGGDLSGLREVLGWWVMPLFVVPGILGLWLGNRALRALARRRLAAARGARP